MSEFGDFLYQSARPLPVILLLDVSGSMHGGKIETLKNAVREMLTDFKKSSNTIVSIQVAIITFGEGGAKLVQKLTDVSNISPNCMAGVDAYGGTPLGAAITMAKQIIDDRQQVPGRAYKPTIVVVTDGMPNDQWEHPLQDFINNGRSAKCDRMAMGIGEETTGGPARNMLMQFTGNNPENLFTADDASQISEFFRFVTMSTITRTRSANPNVSADKATVLKTIKQTTVTAEATSDNSEVDDYPF